MAVKAGVIPAKKQALLLICHRAVAGAQMLTSASQSSVRSMMHVALLTLAHLQ